MKSIKALQQAEEEFEKKFTTLNDLGLPEVTPFIVFEKAPKYINSSFGDVYLEMKKFNKSATLSLLNALKEDIEGEKCTTDNSDDHICGFNDGEQTCDCYDEGLNKATSIIDTVIKSIG